MASISNNKQMKVNKQLKANKPWLMLNEVAKRMYLGETNVEVPTPNASKLTDDAQRKLLKIAEDKLNNYRAGQDVMSLSEAGVALSCTLDLSLPLSFDPSYRFTKLFVESAKEYYKFNLPEWKGVPLMSLAEVLKNGGIRALQKQIAALRCRYYLQEAGPAPPELWKETLDILDYFCNHIEKPFTYGSPAAAEIVEAWKETFKPLARGVVVARSGECVSPSIKKVKEALEKEHKDFGRYGSKVDLMFLDKDDGRELTNFEFKVDNLSLTIIRLQYLKNIRLNRAIMENQHMTSGIRPAIPFMCISGRKGTLFVLYRYEDIFVSKELSTIQLPATEEELVKFLEEDITLRVAKWIMDELESMAQELRNGKAPRSKKQSYLTNVLLPTKAA